MVTVPTFTNKDYYLAVRSLLKKRWLEQIAICKANSLAIRKPHSEYSYSELNNLFWNKAVGRSVARHLHIAYVLIKGKPYEKIECPKENNSPNWKKIQEYINQAIENAAKQEKAVEHVA